MTAEETAVTLMRHYGDQAYHKAVEFSLLSFGCGDVLGCSIYNGAAAILRNLGYADYPKRKVLDGEAAGEAEDGPELHDGR